MGSNYAGVDWALRKASVILPGSSLNSTDRNTAAPSVPPIDRKNVTVEPPWPILRRPRTSLA